MSYEGTVRGGLVVLDPSPTPLPEGARVGVIYRSESQAEEDNTVEPDTRSQAEVFREVIGKVTGLPADAAYQHDHYLYGTPKRP